MRAVVCNVNVLSNRKLQISLSPPLTHLEGMLTRNICSALSRDDDLLAGGRKEERGGGQGGKMHAGPPIVNTLSPILERDRICTPCFPMSDPKSPFPSLLSRLRWRHFHFISPFPLSAAWGLVNKSSPRAPPPPSLLPRVTRPTFTL